MSNPDGYDLSTVMAPIFFGFVMSTCLGGICILQSYIYFLHSRDPWGIKLIAAIMITLDIVSTCLVAQAVYNYLIPHFGSLTPFNTFTLGLSIDCLLSSVITFISQMFFARQLHLVTKSRRLFSVSGVVAICAFIGFAFGVACAAAMMMYKTMVLGTRHPKFVLFFGLQKGFSALTDIIATAGLCTFLSSARTGLDGSDSLIKLLMEFTIERGALVTLIQTLLVLLFFASHQHVYWIPVHINLTKLYANVFFAILNARGILNDRRTGITQITSHGHDAFRLVRANLEEDDRQDKPMPMITKSVVVTEL